MDGSEARGRSAIDDHSGAAAIEAALVLPLVLLIFFGMISYGSFLFTSHMVQQVANDAARASIVGLTAAERQSIALATVKRMIRTGGTLAESRAATTATDADGTVTVSISYDVSQDPLMHLPLVPSPGRSIRVRAVGLTARP